MNLVAGFVLYAVVFVFPLDLQDDFLDFGIFPARVIIRFQVVAEEQRDGLPEVGIHRPAVFPDMGERGVAGFPIDQPDQNLSLGDAQSHERRSEGLHEPGIFFPDDFFAVGFWGNAGKPLFDFPDLGGGSEGERIDFTDIVFQTGIALALPPIPAGSTAFAFDDRFFQAY